MMNDRIPEMEKKIAELKAIENEINELKALAEVLKDEIKEAMGNDTLLIAGPFKVIYQTVVSNRFDTSSFKADYPKLYSAYTKPSVTRPFKVGA